MLAVNDFQNFVMLILRIMNACSLYLKVNQIDASFLKFPPGIPSLILQVGNHIDIVTGKWIALDSGVGAGVDSYFEYLVKGSFLFPYPKLMQMFKGVLDTFDFFQMICVSMQQFLKFIFGLLVPKGND